MYVNVFIYYKSVLEGFTVIYHEQFLCAGDWYFVCYLKICILNFQAWEDIIIDQSISSVRPETMSILMPHLRMFILVPSTV